MFIFPLGLHDMADSWGKRRWLQRGWQPYVKPKAGRNLRVSGPGSCVGVAPHSLVSIVVIFSGNSVSTVVKHK